MRSDLYTAEVQLPQVACGKRQLPKNLQALPSGALALLEVERAQALSQAWYLQELAQERHEARIGEAGILLEADFIDLLPLREHACHGKKVVIRQTTMRSG